MINRARFPLAGLNAVSHVTTLPGSHGALFLLWKAIDIAAELNHGPGTGENEITCLNDAFTLKSLFENDTLWEDEELLLPQSPKNAELWPWLQDWLTFVLAWDWL